ncbi:hypothetical protein D6T63_05645 [Arthrobacter cheniae]|uniref:Uncharacterized protein n=1 Tax=Arthrobacter cheniae TaxID=1258888 RepID=A0A3A5M6S0_9MICC|nr:hypothetical protein D6T63_05645 [Arthrobacter cheniae]
MLGGIVIIKCPHGHTLGRVASGPEESLDQPLSGEGWKAPLTEVLAAPLAMRCPRCESEGRRLDLRGSWETVHTLCRELESNFDDDTTNYRIG